MVRPLSMDLRERAVARLASGESVRAVAAALSVAPSSVVKWSQRLRATGGVAGKMSGHVQPKIAGSHRDWLVARVRAEPFTPQGLVASWPGAVRGLITARSGSSCIANSSASKKPGERAERNAKGGAGATAQVDGCNRFWKMFLKKWMFRAGQATGPTRNIGHGTPTRNGAGQ